MKLTPALSELKYAALRIHRVDNERESRDLSMMSSTDIYSVITEVSSTEQIKLFECGLIDLDRSPLN